MPEGSGESAVGAGGVARGGGFVASTNAMTSDASRISSPIIDWLFNDRESIDALVIMVMLAQLCWAAFWILCWVVYENNQHPSDLSYAQTQPSRITSQSDVRTTNEARPKAATSSETYGTKATVQNTKTMSQPCCEHHNSTARGTVNGHRWEINDPSIETKADIEGYHDVFKLDLAYFEAYKRENRFERSGSGRKHVTVTDERKVTINGPHATGRASTTIADAIVDRRHST